MVKHGWRVSRRSILSVVFMARVLGQAGRYVSEQAGKKQQKMLVVAFAAFGVICWISGFLVGFMFYKKLWWVSLLISGSALVAILVLRRWADSQMDELIKQREDFMRGASGEICVGHKLANFPKGFYVVNDLATPSGNLDHVVIGPTGVFAIDTKSWRGVVSANNDGELLINGRFEKAHVKPFVGRVMGIRERVKALAQEFDAFTQPVFVFTRARVDANWGTTGNVHCIRDDQIYDYIVASKRGKRLNAQEVKTIARAFAALARMDPHFADRAAEKVGAPAL